MRFITSLSGFQVPTRLLSKFEVTIIKGLVVLFIFGVMILGGQLLSSSTETLPQPGRFFSEKFNFQPSTLNPLTYDRGRIFRPTAPLIYSSLLKFSPEGEIKMGVAKDFQIKNGGQDFIFTLKQGIKWHDGKELTSQDIIFTIDQIVGSEKYSPLKSNWKGVKYEKMGPYKVKFSLPNPYPPFILNATIPILPSHLPLSSHKLNPVGTGPFEVERVGTKDNQITRVVLKRYKSFHGKPPFLSGMVFDYYKKDDQLLSELKKTKVDGIHLSLPPAFSKQPPTTSYALSRPLLPRYFAVFFNLEDGELLAEPAVRKALRMGTNKEKLIKEVLGGEGVIINNPIPQFILSEPSGHKDYKNFDLKQAKKTLAPYKGASITLSTVDTPLLQRTASFLKQNWSKLGLKVKIKSFSSRSLLSEIIKPRNYETVLFGQTLSFEPDPFSFWHSTQSVHPGLNLSVYQNTEVDRLLEEARQTLDLEKRLKLFKELNRAIKKDSPAVFLYSPYFLYFTKKEIKGIKLEQLNLPQDRFNEVNEWYVNEARTWGEHSTTDKLTN